MKAPTVSILTHDIGGGAFANLCTALVRGMNELGVNANIVVLKATPDELARHPDLAIVPLNVQKTSHSLWATVRYLRTYRPDILLPMPWYFNIVGVWARFLAGVPTKVILGEHNIISLEAAVEHHDKLHLRLLPILMRYVYPHGDALIGVSQDTLIDLVDNLKIPPTIPMQVILNPINPERVQQLSLAPIDHPWFNPQSVPVIVTAARLAKQKQLDGLLQAFAQVRAVTPVRLVILGEGPLRATLESLAWELGIAEHVWMPGYDPNPYRYMAQAEVFVLASAWEGCPIALQEAMACGAAVVVTDAPGGMKDVVESGKSGMIVPTGQPNALAEGILKLLSQPDLRQRYREEARRRSQDFHHLKTCQQYLDFCELVLGKSLPRRESIGS